MIFPRVIKLYCRPSECVSENALFTRCFRENHGKLYIIGKLIDCRIRK